MWNCAEMYPADEYVRTYFGAVICNLEIALFQYFEPILYTGQHFHCSIEVREWVYQRLGCRRKKI